MRNTSKRAVFLIFGLAVWLYVLFSKIQTSSKVLPYDAVWIYL